MRTAPHFKMIKAVGERTRGRTRFVTIPESKRQCIASSNVSVCSSAITSKSSTKTVEEVRVILRDLDLDEVVRHFSKVNEPYVVCDKVTEDVFNEYFGDDEALPIALRFVELSADGRILIVEFPTPVHETTVDEFKCEFLDQFGNRRHIGKRGSMTARRGGNPNKEADATYGPKGNTPNRTHPPGNLAIEKWITLAVEVARTQNWASLQRAALWWYGYRGIQYILLLQISEDARDMEYHLYDVVNTPVRQPNILRQNVRRLSPLQVTSALPADPTISGAFHRNRRGAPENVTFDNWRILSIPEDEDLPAGVNEETIVNLRDVMQQVIESRSTR